MLYLPKVFSAIITLLPDGGVLCESGQFNKNVYFRLMFILPYFIQKHACYSPQIGLRNLILKKMNFFVTIMETILPGPGNSGKQATSFGPTLISFDGFFLHILPSHQPLLPIDINCMQ